MVERIYLNDLFVISERRRAIVTVAATYNRLSGFTHRMANPARFMRLSTPMLPWLFGVGVSAAAIGILGGLFVTPPDYQQGDTVRIMYVHVPFAWLASMGYFWLALCSLASLVWRHPLADLAAKEISPVGAAFTAVCLATGSLWGKPTWGTYWVWDARLTSVFILLILYLGHVVLIRAFDDQTRGFRTAAILALVGVINLPIIKFSVDWWNTLHQPASITLLGAPTITPSILWPLPFTTLGFTLIFVGIVFCRIQAASMERQARNQITAQRLRSADA
jgi:heme exporter protein C